MHRLIALCTLILALTLGMWAQQPNEPKIPAGAANPTGGWYTFSVETPRINSLWRVVGPAWRRVYDDPENDFLKDPPAYEKNGWTYVMVYPTDEIHIPPGVRARVELVADTPPVTTPTASPAPTPPAPRAEPPWVPSPWLILTIAALLLLMLGEDVYGKLRAGRMAREEEEREAKLADPIGSGPPVVSGGIGPRLGPGEFAAAERALILGAAVLMMTRQRKLRIVGSVRRVRITGIGQISYGDNSVAPEKRLNREPAYEAEIENIVTQKRFTVYALFACANGCISPETYQGDFVVEPYEVGADNIVHFPLASATSADIARYGEPEYDPRTDPAALLAGHMETPSGKIAEALVRRALGNDNGKRPWLPAPIYENRVTANNHWLD